MVCFCLLSLYALYLSWKKSCRRGILSRLRLVLQHVIPKVPKRCFRNTHAVGMEEIPIKNNVSIVKDGWILWKVLVDRAKVRTSRVLLSPHSQTTFTLQLRVSKDSLWRQMGTRIDFWMPSWGRGLEEKVGLSWSLIIHCSWLSNNTTCDWSPIPWLEFLYCRFRSILFDSSCGTPDSDPCGAIFSSSVLRRFS